LASISLAIFSVALTLFHATCSHSAFLLINSVFYKHPKRKKLQKYDHEKKGTKEFGSPFLSNDYKTFCPESISMTKEMR
jgi:hypothetical protein